MRLRRQRSRGLGMRAAAPTAGLVLHARWLRYWLSCAPPFPPPCRPLPDGKSTSRFVRAAMVKELVRRAAVADLPRTIPPASCWHLWHVRAAPLLAPGPRCSPHPPLPLFPPAPAQWGPMPWPTLKVSNWSPAFAGSAIQAAAMLVDSMMGALRLLSMLRCAGWLRRDAAAAVTLAFRLLTN